MEKRYLVQTTIYTHCGEFESLWYSEPHKYLKDANWEAICEWSYLTRAEEKTHTIEVVMVRECDLEEDLDAFDDESGEILDWTAARTFWQRKGYVVNGKVRGK